LAIILLSAIVIPPFRVISHDELLRFQREGLLPDQRSSPKTVSTA
jgi:hypothetical protein